MSLYIVDIHGELEGDYEIIRKYEEPTTKNNLGVDCVSRQAIIDEMEKRHAKGDYITKGFVKKLPSVTPQEPRWIPVSERLPEIHNYTDRYLVTLERGWVRTSMFTECDGNHWWSYDDVVAWMPLPQPYKEVKE